MTSANLSAEEITGRLTIHADFEGWKWHERANLMTITLKLDDVEISSTVVQIEPVEYRGYD